MTPLESWALLGFVLVVGSAAGLALHALLSAAVESVWRWYQWRTLRRASARRRYR